jgi:hypothetical protein
MCRTRYSIGTSSGTGSRYGRRYRAPYALLEPLLRHELEHGAQWQRYGRPFSDLDGHLREVLDARSNPERYLRLPSERGANLAATTYAQEHLDAQHLQRLRATGGTGSSSTARLARRRVRRPRGRDTSVNRPPPRCPSPSCSACFPKRNRALDAAERCSDCFPMISGVKADLQRHQLEVTDWHQWPELGVAHVFRPRRRANALAL